MSLIDVINKYNKVIITGHQNPDGDALGSIHALKNFIQENLEVEVLASHQPVSNLSFLGTPDNVKDSDFNDALCIIVDTANLDRVDDQRYKNAKEIVKIDHHPIVEEYGDYSYVDEVAPATCCIIAKLLFETNLPISYNTKQALIIGITTDTNRLRYRSVTSETFAIMSKLTTDISVCEIYDKLYVNSFDYLKLKGHVLKDIVLQDKLAYVILTKEILDTYNVDLEQAKGLVSELATIDNIEVYFLVYPNDDYFKVSIRSKRLKVNQVAAKYNGGGHNLACSCKIPTLEDLKLVISDLNEVIK